VGIEVLKSLEFIDVSVSLSSDFPVWPGAPKYWLEQKCTDLGNGHKKLDSHFSMIPHFGTHIDAPLHFNMEGPSIDKISPDLLIGSCRVYEHKGPNHISRDDLVKMGVGRQDRVLFKTANSQRFGEHEFNKDYIAFEEEAIEYLVESGVKILGTDGFSIGGFGEASDRNHVIFCEAGGVIIELLNLCDVTPGEYQLIALPLKMKGVEAAPARVLLGSYGL